jgi:CDP-diglyceride synthetase
MPSSFWISILEEYGMSWVLYSVALVVINDTMAYLFGITLGKHALLPKISPKKTVEGFTGAAVSTVFMGILFLPTKKDGLILSLVTSLVGPFGGFLASVMKRAYGKKDFGDMMKGHGGLVDRLDCQIWMAPFVYLYLLFTRAAVASESAQALMGAP